MREEREIICIVCPVGCRIRVAIEEKRIVDLEGNACKRGETYARDEVTAPKRMLTTTVKVEDGELPLVSVRTEKPLPKEKIHAALLELARLKLQAPVAFHQVVCPDVAGTGVAVVAARPMPQAGSGEEKAG